MGCTGSFERSGPDGLLGEGFSGARRGEWAMDSVSVTKSIRVSGEMAARMDNLVGNGTFQTTSELILEALSQFLERYDLAPHTRVLRLKVPAEVERRLKALTEAGDGPTVEEAAVRVLREFSAARLKALVEETSEFNTLREKLRQQLLDAQVGAARREDVVSK